ncbi:MAG TPA: RDD family protein [Caulobacteraceae bacterium]
MAAAEAGSAAGAGDKPGRVRRLVTPEGVDLRLVLGDAGERAAAFLLDAGIIVGCLVAATIVILIAALIFHGPTQELLGILWLLIFFGLRNAYFVAFELRAGAATPGKRALGLRVASRDGRPLTADAVFARNAMREIEVYLPLTFLVTKGRGVDAWIVLAGIVWCGVFALFPLFNRDRLRVGDLVAGTWVVRSPRRRLLPDLAGDAAAGGGRFAFTSAQIDAYGVKELQVLEDVIRRNSSAMIIEVAMRIRRKIGWAAGPSESDRDFLGAYYTALRGRLERRLLFGHRRRDKFDT